MKHGVVSTQFVQLGSMA